MSFGLGTLDVLDQTINHPTNFTIRANDAPLSIFRPTTLIFLSNMLNPIKLIPTDDGLPRDWRGLAELAGVTAETLTYIESRTDPFLELVKLMSRSTEENRLKSIKDLKDLLILIDRFDVVDDGESLFNSDLEFYRIRMSEINDRSPPVLNLAADRDALTYDDTRGNYVPTRYDAFILYADEDSVFANEVIVKLENEYNLKLCVKDRDLLAGTMFEHETVGRIIQERCNRLLVIFSPSFLKSEGNKFLLSVTQALALGKSQFHFCYNSRKQLFHTLVTMEEFKSKERKIIPCMYKRCELPLIVRYCFCLDYNRDGKLLNFWDKLSRSLTAVPNETRAIRPASDEVKMGTSLPDIVSWWDSKKGEDPIEGDSKLLTSVSSVDPILSSSLPRYSTKTPSKKWYKKVIGVGKKKNKEKLALPS